MSSVGDAAHGILAAADESDRVRASLAAVRVELEAARTLLDAACADSAREEPRQAVARLVAGVRTLEDAETLLEDAARLLRSYVVHALGVSDGAPSGVVERAERRPPGSTSPSTLVNSDQAVVPLPKFTRYSMDPAADNGGKWEGWVQLGYDVDSEQARRQSADHVIEQLTRHLPSAVPFGRRDTPYGVAWRTRTPVSGPDGREGTLVVAWLYKHNEEHPTMVTNWVEVHRGDG